MVTFKDIFKKSFLQETGSLTTEIFMLSLLAAFLCAMIIYLVYRNFYKGVIYSNNFNILLVLTTIVTCFIVLVISSNVVLSLGMVGALSIVRFRTAVKDPLDVGFLFWSIAVGITCGAGLYMISVIGTVFVSLVYIFLIKIRTGKSVYLLIVKASEEAVPEVSKKLQHIKKKLKNRTTVKGFSEFTYEVRFYEDNTAFLSEISAIEGVESAVLVDFTGDYCE
ncbi:MAG: DUF4956 domain-containing protein [Clostridia bacterium]|nr:DUF4956 domain-containing protein [uncultured Blautia sp.]MDD5803650.1 DUF4956 domain-containing protein [Clostridia bacterium]